MTLFTKFKDWVFGIKPDTVQPAAPYKVETPVQQASHVAVVDTPVKAVAPVVQVASPPSTESVAAVTNPTKEKKPRSTKPRGQTQQQAVVKLPVAKKTASKKASKKT